MPLTTLEPKTALIVIDLQKGIVSIPAAHRVDEIVTRASALADAFRRRSLPVVLVNVAGAAPGRTEQPRGGGERPAGWTDLIPDLNPRPRDLLVTKRTWGAFTDTGLAEHLQRLGVSRS